MPNKNVLGVKSFIPDIQKLITTVYRENCTRFIFTLWSEGDFKTGLIELYIKEYTRKLESWRIQDWANKFQISIGRK